MSGKGGKLDPALSVVVIEPRRRRGWKMRRPDDYEVVRPARVDDTITVPGQAYSIHDLLERVKRGMPLPGGIVRNGSFGDENASHDDVDLEKVAMMERSDQEEVVKQVIARKDSAVKRYNAELAKLKEGDKGKDVPSPGKSDSYRYDDDVNRSRKRTDGGAPGRDEEASNSERRGSRSQEDEGRRRKSDAE